MSFQIRRVSDGRSRRRFSLKTLAFSAALLRPLSHLYARWKKQRKEEEKQERRVLFLKRILLILIALLCSFLLVAGTVEALVSLRIISMHSVVSIAGVDPPKDEHGFTNILLLGQGDTNHEGKDLTDTIIVASIDPGDTKSVVLLSLPRDLYLMKTESMGKGRINGLYRDYKSFLKRTKGMKEGEASIESMKELAKEIGKNVNLTIHHVVKVDFTGLVQAVDTVGGLDITVPYDILDTEYPDENYGFQTFSLKAGPAHLDGATALKYARSRHSTSDFGRSARQQQIIVALGEKVRQQGLYKNPSKLMDMLQIFSDHVQMTMGIRELVGIAELAEKIPPSHIITMQLNDRNGLFNGLVEPGGFLYAPPRDLFEGASVLLPVSIPEYPVTWRQIHALSRLLFEQRASYLVRPSIAILNAGAKSGLARKLGGELIRFGWNVDTIANASDKKKLPSSFVAPLTEKDLPLAQFFADLLKLPVGSLPPTLQPGEARQVTVILGKEYTYKPLQDLLPAQ